MTLAKVIAAGALVYCSVLGVWFLRTHAYTFAALMGACVCLNVWALFHK